MKRVTKCRRKAAVQFLAFLAGIGPAVAAAEPEPLALIQRTCLRCHSEEKRKGGLLMTSREDLLKGGDSGAAVLPGRSGESFLVETLYPDADPHMPPKSDLTEAEIVAFRDWIDSGASWDEALWTKLEKEPKIEPVELTALPEGFQPSLAVVFAPDGKRFAAGRGEDIELFSIEPGENEKAPPVIQPVARWKAMTGGVQSLAWSPDGSRLAAGGFRMIALFDANSKEQTGVIEAGLAGRITALAFSSDGKTVIAADSIPAASGRIHFIEGTGGTIQQTIAAHGDSVFDLAVSPDGKLLASASADKLVKIWSLEKRERVKTLEGHIGYVLTAAFSPENGRLASAGDDGNVIVWNLKTAKQMASFGPRISAGPINDVAWTVDPAKVKQKAEEKDAEKAKAISTDRIVAVNEAGVPRIYTDLVEHEGAQRSTGAKERAAADSGQKHHAALALDPGSLIFVAGSNGGGLFAWDKDGKLIAEFGAGTPLAQQGE